MADQVLLKMSVHVRGIMATKLLAAAEELGMDPTVVRSQSDGFKVPVELHQYLYPSEYDEGDTAQGRGRRASDFNDLTEAEQEALTNPDGADSSDDGLI